MICLVYYVHSARVAAELHAHHTNTRHILAKQRLGHEIDEQHYAEMLARHGIHETDEDLRMHALEFFERDQNNDQAVSWLEYLEGFHNERLMVELFHHYYGEIYGKGVPNHYHTERHPDAVVDHHEMHEVDEPMHPDHPDYLAPGEEWHGDPETHSSLELKKHLEEIEKEEAKEKATKSSMKNV